MKKPVPLLDLFSLRGRVCLMTGAGGQLGRQMVTALHAAGANVVLTDTSLEACEAVRRRLPSRGPRTLALRMDTTSLPSVEETRDAVRKTFGRLDILVNNAGVAVFTPFDQRTDAEYDHVMNVNVRGVLYCSRVFSAMMRERRRGVIINIGSIYGVVASDPRIYGNSGRNNSEVYAASKAGVVQITRYFAAHLAPFGIRVNAISPGGILNNHNPDFVTKYSAKTPLGRMGFDHELRGAVVFLASDASSYVTGHNLMVDGGFSAW